MGREDNFIRVEVERSQKKLWCYQVAMTFPGVHRRLLTDDDGRVKLFGEKAAAKREGNAAIIDAMNDYYNKCSLVSVTSNHKAEADKLFKRG